MTIWILISTNDEFSMCVTAHTPEMVMKGWSPRCVAVAIRSNVMTFFGMIGTANRSSHSSPSIEFHSWSWDGAAEALGRFVRGQFYWLPFELFLFLLATNRIQFMGKFQTKRQYPVIGYLPNETARYNWFQKKFHIKTKCRLLNIRPIEIPPCALVDGALAAATAAVFVVVFLRKLYALQCNATNSDRRTESVLFLKWHKHTQRLHTMRADSPFDTLSAWFIIKFLN